MSDRLGGFDVLCRCLGEDHSVQTVGRLRADLPALPAILWQHSIEAAGEHLVLPLLWRKLTQKALLPLAPPPLPDMLEELHRLNCIRNSRLRTQVAELGEVLDGIGVTGVLLKGANFLLVSGDRPGDRMMVDIDILVPQSRMAEAVAQLNAAGYRRADQLADGDGFHYPPLVKAGALAAVELHTHLGEQRHILDPDDAIRRSIPMLPGLAALSPTHRIVHNVFHQAAQNRGHVLRLVSLKDLCDFTSIARDHANEIDWDEVKHRFSARPQLLATYAGLAVRLLEWKAPPALRAHVSAADDFGWRAQLRWPLVRRVVEAWASASYPIRRTRIEFLFGPSPSWTALARRRLRHLFGLLRQHGRGVFGRIAVAHANFRDRPARW